MPGMVEEMFGHVHICGDKFAAYDGHIILEMDTDQAVPDIADPATKGCLTHQVREVFPDLEIYKESDSPYWRVSFGHRGYSEDTEAECILAALEAM
jgi:hypothetical protein